MAESAAQEALRTMIADAGYLRAVRHLYDLGMTAGEIQKCLSFPVSAATVERAIRDYEREKQSREPRYEFVRQTNAYGRQSYLRIPATDGGSGPDGTI